MQQLRADLLEPANRMPKPSRCASNRERRGEKGVVGAQIAPANSASCTALIAYRPPAQLHSISWTFAAFLGAPPPGEWTWPGRAGLRNDF